VTAKDNKRAELREEFSRRVKALSDNWDVLNAASVTTGVLSMKLGFICPNASGHLNPIILNPRRLIVNTNRLLNKLRDTLSVSGQSCRGSLEWAHQSFDGRMDYSVIATSTVQDLLGGRR
jgi:hypothetical protein